MRPILYADSLLENAEERRIERSISKKCSLISVRTKLTAFGHCIWCNCRSPTALQIQRLYTDCWKLGVWHLCCGINIFLGALSIAKAQIARGAAVVWHWSEPAPAKVWVRWFRFCLNGSHCYAMTWWYSTEPVFFSSTGSSAMLKDPAHQRPAPYNLISRF